MNPCSRCWRNEQNAAGNADLENGKVGVKQLFLLAFTKGNYFQFQEDKLLARRKSETESAVTYYYDMTALMATVDRGMNEAIKVNYL